MLYTAQYKKGGVVQEESIEELISKCIDVSLIGLVEGMGTYDVKDIWLELTPPELEMLGDDDSEIYFHPEEINNFNCYIEEEAYNQYEEYKENR